MRRLALALLASLQIAVLYGQSINYETPAIGRCATNALRIRSFPSLKEDSSRVIGSLSSGDEIVVLGRMSDAITIDGLTSSWYLIVSMDGVQGWCFGGYIDLGSAKLNVFEYVEDASGDVGQDSKPLAVDGGSCRLIAFSGPTPEAEALFAKTAKGRSQVLYVRYTDYTDYASVKGIKAVDYFADASKELCVEVYGGGGDQAGSTIYLFGRSAQESRYTAYGELSLGDHAGGGGWDMGSGSIVVEGPSPFIMGKNRFIRLVKRSINITPVEDRGDGIRRRRIDQTEFEELYALSGSKLALLRTTTYSVDTTEEEQPTQ